MACAGSGRRGTLLRVGMALAGSAQWVQSSGRLALCSRSLAAYVARALASFSLLAVAALLLGGAEPPSALPRGWHCLVKLTDGPHAQANVKA